MSSSDDLEKFPFVGCQIGTGKYVLLRLSYQGKTRLIVRQNISAEFHKDVARPTMNSAQKSRIDCEILGGGRLTFDPSNRKVHIYGYSVDFGRANHSLTKEIMLQSFPDYEVTWTNEGY